MTASVKPSDAGRIAGVVVCVALAAITPFVAGAATGLLAVIPLGCALWLEHHAPMAQNGSRELRPVESGVWSRWPEFGIALRRDGDTRKRFRVERFRGDRDERCWPDYLEWGSRWPFEAVWTDGMPGGLFDGNWDAA